MSTPRIISRLLRPAPGAFSARSASAVTRSFGTTGLRFKGPGDAYTGKLEHFTGGRQDQGPQKPDLEVGEMEGITFKVEPLKRSGEDTTTTRARLLCSSPQFTQIWLYNVQPVRTKANNITQQTKAASAVSLNPISSSQHSPMST